MGIFLAVLQALLIVFKLAGVGSAASWPWLWVLAPFWAIPAFLVLVFLVALIVTMIVAVFK